MGVWHEKYLKCNYLIKIYSKNIWFFNSGEDFPCIQRKCFSYKQSKEVLVLDPGSCISCTQFSNRIYLPELSFSLYSLISLWSEYRVLFVYFHLLSCLILTVPLLPQIILSAFYWKTRGTLDNFYFLFILNQMPCKIMHHLLFCTWKSSCSHPPQPLMP